MSQWAGGPPRRRVTELTNRRARKRQENKPALSTLIARIVPGAVRECDVPVPPCSVFRLLLSSLSYSRTWPFAVAKATPVCTRPHQPGCGRRASVLARSDHSTATEEPAPSLILPPTSVHVIVWCGDTPVVPRSLDDRCERHKRASRAWSARWPASPKGHIESEPRGPSQLRGGVGSHASHPSQLRIVTIRHGLDVFVIMLPFIGEKLKQKGRAFRGGRLASTPPPCALSTSASDWRRASASAESNDSRRRRSASAPRLAAATSPTAATFHLADGSDAAGADNCRSPLGPPLALSPLLAPADCTAATHHRRTREVCHYAISSIEASA